MGFLGAALPARGTPAADRFKNMKIDADLAAKNIAPIRCPVLILVGTKDGFLSIDRTLHDLLTAAQKPVQMHIYANGYHDFCMGPQGNRGRSEPLLDATLDALELSVRFAKQEVKSTVDQPTGRNSKP
jgi:acetyl esterase/lipase